MSTPSEHPAELDRRNPEAEIAARAAAHRRTRREGFGSPIRPVAIL
ncbi:hypothetical protein [Microbacterium sp. B35-04]|nr:hypothetical protein [Microbacterium sp. B35-04]